MLTPFIVSIQFLTRLPLGAPRRPTPHQLGQSLLCYPLVGALIGIVLWLIAAAGAAAGLALDSGAAAALLLVVLTAASGALHLEGLADSSDGWGASHGNPQRALEVMRDPHCGAMAVVAVALVMVCKFAALHGLVGTAAGALVAAPMLARAAVIALYATTPYVRAGGIGAELARNLPRRHGGVALMASALMTLLLCGVAGGLLLLVVAAAVCYGLRSLMMRLIGGATGDTTGAMIELIETAVLLTAALLV